MKKILDWEKFDENVEFGEPIAVIFMVILALIGMMIIGIIIWTLGLYYPEGFLWIFAGFIFWIFRKAYDKGYIFPKE